MQLGADALAVDDAIQARAAFSQLLELGRKNSRLDLVWPAQHGLGRAALAAHDPLAGDRAPRTIRRGCPNNRATSSLTAPYRSLTTALMMQSSSAERSVCRARLRRGGASQGGSALSACDLARTSPRRCGTGDMVVAVLVGDRHAHAWAFDRSTLDRLSVAADRRKSPPPSSALTAYASQKDRAGVQRIAR